MVKPNYGSALTLNELFFYAPSKLLTMADKTPGQMQKDLACHLCPRIFHKPFSLRRHATQMHGGARLEHQSRNYSPPSMMVMRSTRSTRERRPLGDITNKVIAENKVIANKKIIPNTVRNKVICRLSLPDIGVAGKSMLEKRYKIHINGDLGRKRKAKQVETEEEEEDDEVEFLQVVVAKKVKTSSRDLMAPKEKTSPVDNVAVKDNISVLKIASPVDNVAKDKKKTSSQDLMATKDITYPVVPVVAAKYKKTAILDMMSAKNKASPLDNVAVNGMISMLDSVPDKGKTSPLDIKCREMEDAAMRALGMDHSTVGEEEPLMPKVSFKAKKTARKDVMPATPEKKKKTAEEDAVHEIGFCEVFIVE